MKKILTIAGSDCSGGAGIQADLKTILAHNCYGMSAITALTAQNTLGVYQTLDVGYSFIGSQLDAVFKDIYPDSIKIGMLLNKSNSKEVAKKLAKYRATNIVYDPVMVSSSGRRLLDDDAINTIKTDLLQHVDILTPNISEAEVLTNLAIHTKDDMIRAAKEISVFFKGHILIKGGHSSDNADDLIYIDGKYEWFRSERIENPNSHGTGCTLSSAIACNLALGNDAFKSVYMAKKYIIKLLKDDMDLGSGSGPLNHSIL